MHTRVTWVAVLLLALGGLYILFFPLPSPGQCFWAWGGQVLGSGIRNCAWNTSREASQLFVLTSLFALALLLGAARTAAILLGVRARLATSAFGVAAVVLVALGLMAIGASVELRPPTETAAPAIQAPPGR